MQKAYLVKGPREAASHSTLLRKRRFNLNGPHIIKRYYGGMCDVEQELYTTFNVNVVETKER